MKKHDLPAMPWYWGDWFKCPEVRALSPAARCLWFEMLGLMWESTPRGYLVLGGKPYPKEALGRCLGFACDLLEVLLGEMEQYAVYSKTEGGIIYSRRIIRDMEISKIRADAGRKGGICSSFAKGFAKANTQANTEDEDEDEIETVSVSNSGDHKGDDKEFLEFWSMYPRRVGKGNAVKAWTKAVKKSSSIEIMAGLERYKEKINRDGTEEKFIAHPATWLNANRWEDEITELQKQTPQSIADKYVIRETPQT